MPSRDLEVQAPLPSTHSSAAVACISSFSLAPTELSVVTSHSHPLSRNATPRTHSANSASAAGVAVVARCNSTSSQWAQNVANRSVECIQFNLLLRVGEVNAGSWQVAHCPVRLFSIFLANSTFYNFVMRYRPLRFKKIYPTDVNFTFLKWIWVTLFFHNYDVAQDELLNMTCSCLLLLFPFFSFNYYSVNCHLDWNNFQGSKVFMLFTQLDYLNYFFLPMHYD